MSGSNIFMQLITAKGPVIGEALLDGYLGSIELKDFDWDMKVKDDSTANAAGGFAGGVAGALKNLVGAGKNVSCELGNLKFTKRFDVASSMIHTCCDQNTKVISASITVVHIRSASTGISIPGVGAIGNYMPGFILLATNGYFSDVTVKIQSDGNLAEVVETCTLNFQHITMTYLKTLLGTNIPTLPFSAGKLAPL